MATSNDWLEIMKKPVPRIREGLKKAENSLARSRKDLKKNMTIVLSHIGVFALSASPLYFDFIRIFLNQHQHLVTLFYLVFFACVIFSFLSILYLFAIVVDIFCIKSDKRDVQKYRDKHRVELENADAIGYEFERLKNTVANHIRQLSELQILQILKDNEIKSWAKDLLQKELDQRISTPLAVDCALETYEKVCQKPPILRI